MKTEPAHFLSLDDSPTPHPEALGWQWAYGCFETFLWRRGGTIALDRHLRRFEKGLQSLLLAPPRPLEDLAVRIGRALEPIARGTLRVRLEGVLDDPGLMEGLPPPYRMRIGLRAVEVQPPTRRGDFRVRLLLPGSAEDLPPLPGYKPLAYSERLLGRNTILRVGFSEGLLCTRDLGIVSGFISNLFVRNREGVWITPSLESGCLAGVTRGLLLEMDWDEEIREGRVHLQDLKDATAAVMVNSGWGVQPIHRLQIEADSGVDLDVRSPSAMADRYEEVTR